MNAGELVETGAFTTRFTIAKILLPPTCDFFTNHLAKSYI